jgi:hypothetical protein
MAEPRAREAYAQYCAVEGMNTPVGAPVVGLGVAIFFSAAPKIASQPPNLEGR